jgi:hypothetical protein
MLAGDFFQLPSIKCLLQFFSDLILNPTEQYAKLSNEGLKLYKNEFQSYIELTKNYRQIADESGFVSALLRARVNWVGNEEFLDADLELFNTRFTEDTIEELLDTLPEDTLILGTTRKRITEINLLQKARLARRGETEFTVYAQHFPQDVTILPNRNDNSGVTSEENESDEEEQVRHIH